MNSLHGVDAFIESGRMAEADCPRIPCLDSTRTADAAECIANETPFVVRQHPDVVHLGNTLSIATLPQIAQDIEIEVEHKHRWSQLRQLISSHKYFGELNATDYYWRQVPLSTFDTQFQLPQYYGTTRHDLQFVDHAWIGPAGAVQTFHQDNHNDVIVNHNLYLQIEGSKYLAVVAPSDSSYLHSRPLFRGATRHSSASPFDSHSWEFCSTMAYEFLHAGDVAFIPCRFWHFLCSLSPSISISRWWFENRLAELLYLTATCPLHLASRAIADTACWERDLADIGGPSVLRPILKSLTLVQRYQFAHAFERAYGVSAKEILTALR